MALFLFNKIFSTKHERDIREMQPVVKKINDLEAEMKEWSEAQFKEKTREFKQKLAESQVTLNQLLPQAFAMVREASVRVLEMRHFDVQLMGGMVLYAGRIAEMKTGEGKTLTATLAAYMRALEEKGVHIVTVNDYLSKRDAEWMGPIYTYLGLTVDCIDKYPAHSPERSLAYRADIVYGTNNEFGFDYLRDNMVEHVDHRVQKKRHYCIIDEVDSILIDEARTPLIISGPSESDTTKYYEIDKIIPRLREAKRGEQGREIPGTGDYVIDIKDRNLFISEDGGKKIEKLLGIESLYSQQNMEILHHANQALKAHKIMKRDVDYIVEGGEVIIVDEFTGRKMEGRRFSDGLHQAIEAKERLNIARENQTLASITFQNYFRMYDMMAGMTGTADTEAEELKKIYNLEVVVVPTNVLMCRDDHEDKIYRTETEKNHAVIERVREAYRKGQPVLIGTISVEKSEKLSLMLSRSGLKHEVLNAKNHAREASIIEDAGKRGAITIATNMAGRGTDIKLREGVKEAGGLLIIGSERAESRRVDNQLRGRSGRQGDIGESQFYLSLEDDLMRRFGSERLSSLMQRLGMQEGEEIQHRWVSRAIGNAQKKVEARNFEIRKHLLEYDDVMNSQRQFIYRERDHFLKHDDMTEKVNEVLEDVISDQVFSFAGEREQVSEELFESLTKWLKGVFRIELPYSKKDFLKFKYDKLEEELIHLTKGAYQNRFIGIPKEIVAAMERSVLLHILDQRWKEHLLRMDHLRDGINLRSYGEKKPLTEFKREGFSMFEEMIHNFKFEVNETLFRVRLMPRQAEQITHPRTPVMENHKEPGSFLGSEADRSPVRTKAEPVLSTKSIGRNEVCFCGSGRKYKHCHGRVA